MTKILRIQRLQVPKNNAMNCVTKVTGSLLRLYSSINNNILGKIYDCCSKSCKKLIYLNNSSQGLRPVCFLKAVEKCEMEE